MIARPLSLATATVLLALAGCADPREGELIEVREALDRLAVQCLKDTNTVPAQHSLNCIEATKLAHPVYNAGSTENSLFEHCLDSETEACDLYGTSLLFAQMRYWKAIAGSVARSGLPEDTPDSHSGIGFYQFADRMMPYFSECLEKHPDPPKPRRIESESSPADQGPPVPDHRIIEENVHCIALKVPGTKTISPHQ